MHQLYGLAMLNGKKTKPMKRVTVMVDLDDFATLDQLARHRDDHLINVTPGGEVS